MSFDNICPMSFQDLIEDAGYTCCPYTGRGMNKECLGVCIDDNKLGKFLADVIDESSEDLEEKSEIAKAIRVMQTDSMGKGIIVYFPGVEFEG